MYEVWILMNKKSRMFRWLEKSSKILKFFYFSVGFGNVAWKLFLKKLSRIVPSSALTLTVNWMSPRFLRLNRQALKQRYVGWSTIQQHKKRSLKSWIPSRKKIFTPSWDRFQRSSRRISCTCFHALLNSVRRDFFRVTLTCSLHLLPLAVSTNVVAENLLVSFPNQQSQNNKFTCFLHNCVVSRAKTKQNISCSLILNKVARITRFDVKICREARIRWQKCREKYFSAI